ncbi:fimbrial protein [Serratia oryzae]|uniref:fimbrial protein n=1 Tax=Serratia oryzae TaxID=2034155 RepID=UPI0012E1905E|nr:fimbrial protein [Serratia oryzae]
MKLTKLALAAVLAFGVTSVANAAGGGGNVNFKGSIIDAPCSIAPESLNQEVDFGAVANTALVNGGTSAVQTFKIKLLKCDITSAPVRNKVKVKFQGAKGGAAGDSDELLGITGDAKGASIAMFDGSNQPIKLGVDTGLTDLIAGDNTLNFSSVLKGHTGTVLADIKEGTFTSIATFALTYQ